MNNSSPCNSQYDTISFTLCVLTMPVHSQDSTPSQLPSKHVNKKDEHKALFRHFCFIKIIKIIYMYIMCIKIVY